MAYHGAFHFMLLIKAWLSRAIKMMSERRLFLVKKFIFGLLSLSHKENHAHYLSHTTVRLSLKDLPSQSLACISCLSSRYSQVSLSYATYQNSDNRFK